jgi:outer membrane receptor protein involved in Fe transport
MRGICCVVIVAAPFAAHAEPTIDNQPSSSLNPDAALLPLSRGDTIEIYDERPDKPFDRDTEIRLTGEQLAARGAVDLGTALALLPDVAVRDAGRGGYNIDIRGARKGAVSIFVDGVLVTDPYYGTFDVSTIPITDIVQIRVATTPQSPIDGPGGPGGVVEVHTRDAIGPQLVIARLTADTLPTFGMTGMARVALAEHLALRLSASGLGGNHDFDLAPGGMASTVNEQRNAESGAARLEYRQGTRRLAVDGFVDNRHYLSPPSDELTTATFLMIDREATERAAAKYDDQIGKLQLQAQGWVDHLYRRSRTFMDAAFTNEVLLEDLSALRSGGMVLVTRPIGKDLRWAASGSVNHESVVVSDLRGDRTDAQVTTIEAAGDVQYEHGTVRLDGAAGVAAPTGLGANPWPEAKLVARWRPSYGPLELTATAARKGRTPSLRERFDPTQGNPSLGPEMIDHGEVRAIETVGNDLRFEAAPFYKHSTGTIRASTAPGSGMKLINLGTLDYYGVDLVGRVRVHPRVEVGASYDYIKVTQRATDTSPPVADPLDRLPHHRADGWVQVNPRPGMSLLARAHYFGMSIDQTVHVPGYTLVELTGNAQLARDYLLVLRCDDLLDVRPETRAGYHAEGRTVSVVVQGQW